MYQNLFLISIVAISLVSSFDLEYNLVNGLTEHNEEQVFTLYQKYRPMGKLTDESFTYFQQNLKRIAQVNSDKTSTWRAGINDFAFISQEQFKQNYLGSQNCSATAAATLNKNENHQYLEKPSAVQVPDTIDWRDMGVVSTVKNQQSCGSCWSFSTTGALESHWAIKTRTTPQLLSEQQLLDCAQAFNNFGCNGGLPSQAFQYIKSTGGLNSEETYPYEAIDTPTCQFNQNAIGAKVPGGSYNITAYDEQELKEKMGSEGPVTISFRVFGDFSFYTSGVYNDPDCPGGPDTVNHAVLGVGYGTENGTDYWLVKNSWSEKWGDQGYFQILRGNNTCGVSVCASYPLLAAPQSIN